MEPKVARGEQIDKIRDEMMTLYEINTKELHFIILIMEFTSAFGLKMNEVAKILKATSFFLEESQPIVDSIKASRKK